MIKVMTWDEIHYIWSNHLWQGRSDIRPMSSMTYSGNYDISVYSKYTPVFLAYLVNGEVAGVNSGHRVSDIEYRSRGLYVFPKYRGMGIGIELLRALIPYATEDGCHYIWSLPKVSAINTYRSAGFVISDEDIVTDTGVNRYAIQTLKSAQ